MRTSRPCWTSTCARSCAPTAVRWRLLRCFKLKGKCAGCPAADLTTEELIQTALTEHLPHIKRAVLVQDISPELLDEARSILKMRHGG